jgi:hypothetical protein
VIDFAMIDGEALLGAIVEILKRRNRVSGPDSETGTFMLMDDDRTVRVTLQSDFLAEYFRQLDVQDILGVSASPEDAQGEAKIKYIAMVIEEIFYSDIQSSLSGIQLGRSGDGTIALVAHDGPARAPFPPSGVEAGYWSAHRPGT